MHAVRGALSFASSNDLVSRFDHAGDPAHVVIDLSDEPGRAWHIRLSGQLGAGG